MWQNMQKIRTCVCINPTGEEKTIWKMEKYAENGDVSALITREKVTPEFQTWVVSSGVISVCELDKD